MGWYKGVSNFLRHERGKFAHDRIDLTMQILENFVNDPSTDQFYCVKIDTSE